MNLGLEHQSAQLHLEAMTILEGGLLDLLESQFGQIYVAGSVAANLMTWPDIDLYCQLEHSERSKLIGFAPLLSEQLERQGYSLAKFIYNDEHLIPDPNLPGANGLYGGFQFLHQQSRALWKLDFWGWDTVGFTERHAHHVELTEKLKTANRGLILELKNSLHNHPEYRKSIYSVDIYEFVLENLGASLEDFWAYISAKRKSV